MARQRVVILSKRPGGEWAMRNDRISEGGEFADKSLERQMAEANRQRMGWQAVEADTTFLVKAVNYGSDPFANLS